MPSRTVERAAEDVVGPDLRDTPADLVVRQPLRHHAEAVLQGDVLAKGGHVGGAGEHKQVATLPQTNRVPGLGLELLEHVDALDRQPNVDLGRELVADPASTLARRPLPEQLRPFE